MMDIKAQLEMQRLYDKGQWGKLKAPNSNTSPDLDQLRADYKELIGKRPFHGWDAATIQAKIDEALNVTDN